MMYGRGEEGGNANQAKREPKKKRLDTLTPHRKVDRLRGKGRETPMIFEIPRRKWKVESPKKRA